MAAANLNDQVLTYAGYVPGYKTTNFKISRKNLGPQPQPSLVKCDPVPTAPEAVVKLLGMQRTDGIRLIVPNYQTVHILHHSALPMTIGIQGSDPTTFKATWNGTLR